MSVVPAGSTISAADVVSSRICCRAVASSATAVARTAAVQAVQLGHQLARDLFRRNDRDADLGRRGGMEGADIGQDERELQAEHAQNQDDRPGGDGVLPLVPESPRWGRGFDRMVAARLLDGWSRRFGRTGGRR